MISEKTQNRFQCATNKTIKKQSQFRKQTELKKYIYIHTYIPRGGTVAATTASQTGYLTISIQVQSDLSRFSSEVKSLAYSNKLYVMPPVSHRYLRGCCCSTKLLRQWVFFWGGQQDIDTEGTI